MLSVLQVSVKMLNPTTFFEKKIDRHLLESISIGVYLSETKTVEIDSDKPKFNSCCDKLPDCGRTNPDDNVSNEKSEIGSFLPGNLN